MSNTKPSAAEPAAEPAAALWLRVRNARTHNLRSVDVDLPLHSLCVITGVSGCGKSSLARDTIAAEGRRRYLEALSIGRPLGSDRPPRPPVDRIENLPPTIVLGQSAARFDVGSTLATISEIWPLTQVLYARAGVLHCPNCQAPVHVHSRRDIIDAILTHPPRTRFLILAPIVQAQSGNHEDVFPRIAQLGYVRARVDGDTIDVAAPPPLDPSHLHSIEAVIDRLVVKEGLRGRLEESLEAALELGDGLCLTSTEVEGVWRDQWWPTKPVCRECRQAFAPIEPRTFSWHGTSGMCEACQGLGRPADASDVPCPDCAGSRLGPLPRAVQFAGCDIVTWLKQSVTEACGRTREWIKAGQVDSFHWLDTAERQLVARRVLPELLTRLECLEAIGLDYLTLDRAASSLSHGERQRARLAAALGGQTLGTLFVLDEPTSGLHAVDTERLLVHLRQLCAAGNSIVAVEHNLHVVAHADWIVDLGPGAGPRGGTVLATGTPSGIAQSQSSPTGLALKAIGTRIRRSRSTVVPTARPVADREIRPCLKASLQLVGCRRHNLQNVTAELPLGSVVGVAGVSGSGKTTLILETLLPALRYQIGASNVRPSDYDELRGADACLAVVAIDQQMPGRSSAATPATLSGVWTEFRRLFAKTRDARKLGLKPDRFSYRHPDSRCGRCRGRGNIPHLSFGGELWSQTCPECHGRRFNRVVRSVTYRQRSAADVLTMTVESAAEEFAAIPKIAQPLNTLVSLGLGYLPLGQTGTSLSGGELQRLHLARHLSRGAGGPTVFLLDEPTAGLHAAEISLLVHALRALTASQHTVVVIEHNLELLRQVDWLVELGPGSGPLGGQIVTAGTPDQVAADDTPTGWALAPR